MGLRWLLTCTSGTTQLEGFTFHIGPAKIIVLMEQTEPALLTAITTSVDTGKKSVPLSPRLLILVAVAGAIYGQTVLGLVDDWWNEPNSSYGALVPPLAGYVAWQRRRLTLDLPIMPDPKGLLWILAGCGTLLVGKLGAELFLSRISIVILLTGLAYTFWGKSRLRTLMFPILLLATMVPLPVIVFNSLAQPLQLFASSVSARVAQIFGVSVFQDGNIIQLADTTLGVAEACSGLRSLSALMVMALLLGFLRCRRPITRLLLFALTFPIAVFVNVIRVSGTAIMADYDSRLAMGFYHTFSSWLVFLLGIAFVFGASWLIRQTLERPQ
jgi:exosortase